MLRIKDAKKVEALQLSENFKGSEFACKHCGQLEIHERLIHLLQQLRTTIGTPMIITSGYRCPTHNRNVGGSSRSLHMKGHAADFVFLGRQNAVNVFTEACRIFANGRVGLYQSSNSPLSAYMHVDIGEPGTWWLSYPVPSGGRTRRVYTYYKSIANFTKAMQIDKQRDWFRMSI